MGRQRDKQLAWLDAVLEKTGMNISEVATASGLDHSSLSKFRSGKTQTLRRKNILRISAVTGIAPPEGSPVAGFSEGDAVAFDLKSLDLVVPDAQTPTRFPVKIATDGLSAAGFERDDILIFDAKVTPKNGDIVCAQIVDERLGTAETVIRLYEKPYLIAPCTGVTGSAILIVNDKDVQVRGVLWRQIRIRNFHSAA